jgi:broad specificity phosphatase PhoE
MKVTLIRHGESEANVGLTEHLDSPLTPLGRRQAARAAERLKDAGITRIFVSPLRRTLETAAPICAAIYAPAELYPDVCEFFADERYHVFPGLLAEELRGGFPWVTLGESFPGDGPWWPCGVEDRPTLYARAARVRDALVQAYGETDEHILIVTHGDPLKSLMETFLALPPSVGGPPWTGNCALTCLECAAADERVTLLCADDTTHLAGL